MSDIFEGPKTVHVYSTLTNDQIYPVYGKSPQGDHVVEAHVLIRGGAHRINRALVTPLGMRTSISERALEHLERSPVFQAHVNRGYITVRRDQVDIERAVAAHTSHRDPSAPIVPEDYTNVDPNDPEKMEAIPVGTKGGKGRKPNLKEQPAWKQ